MSEIKGHVIIKDKDNRIIVDSDNMIVKNGRKYIFDIFTNSLGISENNTTVDSWYLLLGDNRSATTETTEINPLISVEINSNNITLDSTNLSIKVDNTISSEADMLTISEAGLGFKSGDTTKTFSRILFDPMIVNPETSFTLSYYIYF